ncbi:hypothetical protein IWW56_005991, partial [Coemansia sp. RSA 2131]
MSPKEPAVLPKEPATSPKEPAALAGKPRNPKKPNPEKYTQEGYWERVVDLKMKSFKDHAQHVFTGYVMTDGVSISVIRKNKEKLAAKVASKKRKREEQAQQEQPVAQRARLVYQPVQPAQLSFQQLSFQPVQLLPQQMLMSVQPAPPSFQQPAVQPLYPQVPLSYHLVQSLFQPAPPSFQSAQSVQPQHMPMPMQLPSYQPVQLLQQMSMSSQNVWLLSQLPSYQQTQHARSLVQQAQLLAQYVGPLDQQTQHEWILAAQQMQNVRPLLQQVWILALQAHQAQILAQQAQILVQQAWQAQQAWILAQQAWKQSQEAWILAQPAQPLAQQQPVQQERPLVKKAKQRRPAQLRQQADCAYIDDLPQAQLQSTAGRCVLVDPGQRDLLFMMHEDSTIEEKKVYRYTRNQQRKETRLTKFKRILEKVKPADVAEAERSLGTGSCVKPDLELYKVYLVARERVADTLTRFYNKTYTVHPTSSHQIHMYKTSEPQSFPLHRKLRLSAYVNRKQADQYLIKKLREEFGPNAVIVIGNWSAPMTRYHEPIRGKSWRTLLKRGGFDVYLIKEYLTSKTCPNCN